MTESGLPALSNCNADIGNLQGQYSRTYTAAAVYRRSRQMKQVATCITCLKTALECLVRLFAAVLNVLPVYLAAAG